METTVVFRLWGLGCRVGIGEVKKKRAIIL